MNIYKLILYLIVVIIYTYIIKYYFYQKNNKSQIGGDINKDGSFIFNLEDAHKTKYLPRKFNKDLYHSKSIKIDKSKLKNNSYYIPIDYMTIKQQQSFLKNANFNKMTNIDFDNYFKLLKNNNINNKEIYENNIL